MVIVLKQKISLSLKNICFEAIQNVGKSEHFKLEQRFFIKFLAPDECKLSEIYRIMYDMYLRAVFVLRPTNRASMTQGLFKVGPGVGP